MRYQIKCRHANTLNIDFNGFDFDVLVLVNLDELYMPAGMWTMPVGQVKALCVSREKFRKFQVAQGRLKREGTRIE